MSYLERLVKFAKVTTPVAALALTTSCTPAGIARMPEGFNGCIVKEGWTPDTNLNGTSATPRHRLHLYLHKFSRIIKLESVGVFGKNIDAKFNKGDEVRLIITQTAPYDRNSIASRQAADLDIHLRINRMIQSQTLALDESKVETDLVMLAPGACKT